MSIQELSLKFKEFFTDTEKLLVLLIIAVSLASFYLGRVSVGSDIQRFQATSAPQQEAGREPHNVLGNTHEQVSNVLSSEKNETSVPTDRGYVASKSGTKYHLPWCPGAKQIKDTNKLYFATKEEAEAAGYSPAANCKGI